MSWYSYGFTQNRGQPLQQFEQSTRPVVTVQGERFELIAERNGAWRKLYLRPQKANGNE